MNRHPNAAKNLRKHWNWRVKVGKISSTFFRVSNSSFPKPDQWPYMGNQSQLLRTIMVMEMFPQTEWPNSPVQTLLIVAIILLNNERFACLLARPAGSRVVLVPLLSASELKPHASSMTLRAWLQEWFCSLCLFVVGKRTGSTSKIVFILSSVSGLVSRKKEEFNLDCKQI